MISPLLQSAVRAAQHPAFFFVNIGAHDGISNDPIYPFAREYGWHGLAVEPVGHVFEVLQRNYRDLPGVALERAAIASVPRPLYAIDPRSGCRQPWVSQVASFDREHVLAAIREMRTHRHQGPVREDMEDFVVACDVPCLTFDELMRKHRVRHVDFLNIDAEGADNEILSDIDLVRFHPQILCIETAAMPPAERVACEQRLAAAGYRYLDRFDLFSSVYVRQSLA